LNPRPQRPERCALARLRYSPEEKKYYIRNVPNFEALFLKKGSGLGLTPSNSDISA
jgi:hypothetical protein